MAEAVAGPSGINFDRNLRFPTDCLQCNVGYGEFFHYLSSGGKQVVIEYAQRHNLMLKEKNCECCGAICRIDYNKNSFRCDRSVVTKGRRRKRCNFSVSLSKGTWFDKSHLCFEVNLKFVKLWCSPNFSYNLAEGELQLSQATICDWASFCREVAISWVFRNSGKIGGVGLTVEIDESKFGKRKYNVGRVIDGQWVFVGICRETRQCVLVPVKLRSAETLLPIIQQFFEPGTTIVSDCWKAYNCLQELGYQHLQVNHSLNFVDPVTLATQIP
ncbi:uncharacterized protein LOC135199936 [Macrobrachium nipponense]|uniref:uncharacterized protein LOC135199936 n=1 Tax=Macrobrachium nipponense TaxID=159736 RepID=UPI0030C88657